jgi:hypothetical protein
MKDPETIQGYLCLAVAAALGLTVLTIVVACIVSWL